MSVSVALEKSAKDFCFKYSCDFNFSTFESRVEEFTFLRTVDGWNDVYKMAFEQTYKQAFESAMKVSNFNFDTEAMLDDFEYTLIRPYVNECKKDIKHKPYVGMDRISRIDYLTRLAKKAPSNAVEMNVEKYKRGELSIKQMTSDLELSGVGKDRLVEVAGYAQTLKIVNNSRSHTWRTLHPFKNSAEKRSSEIIKKTFIEKVQGGEAAYNEALAEACKIFVGYQTINSNLELSMARAKEEASRKQKMDDVMRESIRVENSENTSMRELSLRVEQHKTPTKENQI